MCAACAIPEAANRTLSAHDHNLIKEYELGRVVAPGRDPGGSDHARRKKMLKHVVLMKFKTDVGQVDIAELQRSLAELPGNIPEILGFEFGRDVVRSQRSYDFALVSSFADLEALKRYQVHPAHQNALKLVLRMCDSIVAVDFLQ
jgi:hypothetical protein